MKSTSTKRSKRRGSGVEGDLVLSADFACNACGISFQPPSPQLFSFNSPQGMCYECDGLGQMFSFDPDKLVTDPDKSFAKGCIELLGTWKDLSRWKRHIYKGVADTMERKLELEAGTLAETPWQRAYRGATVHLALGLPAKSTSPTPGGAERTRRSTAARSTASFPNCSKSIVLPRANR